MKCRDQKSYEVHDRKSLDCLEETVGRNMDGKGTSDEVSNKNEKHLSGN